MGAGWDLWREGSQDLSSEHWTIDSVDTEIMQDQQRKGPEMCKCETGSSWHEREGPRRVDSSNQDGEWDPMASVSKGQISGQGRDNGRPFTLYRPPPPAQEYTGRGEKPQIIWPGQGRRSPRENRRAKMNLKEN